MRRLNAVPAEELPLGEDAIELVADEPDDASPAETTIDLTEAGLGTEQPVEAYLAEDAEEAADSSDDDSEQDTPPSEPAAEDDRSPAADEPPSRRPARKARGRASVPSWDEIMFGGPGEK
ncbi:DNA-binding protein [Nocardioides sp. CF8]|nr:DNA-binding protein [Nocardioides sp. CF8]